MNTENGICAEENNIPLPGNNVVQEINLLQILQVLLERKMFIIKTCLLTALLSAGYSLSLPNIYSATAKVFPPQKEGGSGLTALLGQVGGGVGLTAASIATGNDIYVDILKSRSLKDAVIQRLNLANKPDAKTLEALRDRLDDTVKVQGAKNGIISISALDKDPKRAAIISNAFVAELSTTMVRLNLSKAGTERVFLEDRLKIVKKDLKQAEDDFKDFAQKHKIMQVESQVSMSYAAIARLKADIASTEAKLSALRTVQTDEHSEVKSLQTTLNIQKRKLTEQSGTSVDTGGLPSLGDMPQLALEYSRKQRELKTQAALFEQLTKQYELAKLSEAKDTSSLQVLDEAVPPVNKVKPRRTFIVLVATAASFFFSLFMVFFQEYLKRMPDSDRMHLNNLKREAVRFK